MNKQWHDFLRSIGAVVNGITVEHFGNPNLERLANAEDGILADLSSWSLIAVSGNDAGSFLHRQFTNDVLNLPEGRSQLNAYCNAQGRVRALFRLFAWQQQYFLQLPSELCTATIEQLRKFVLMAKVTLDDASDHRVRIGYAASAAQERLLDLFPAIPRAADDVVFHNDAAIIRLPGLPLRYEIVADMAVAKKIWTSLNAHAVAVGSARWRHLDVLSGIPNIMPPTAEDFLPQDINLDLVGAVSFNKGCYPGQEVIARLYHRGTIKRRLSLVRLECTAPPGVGDRLSIGVGNEYATLVNIEASPDSGEYDALLVVPVPFCKNQEVFPVGGSLMRGRAIPLPYTVPECM